MSPSGDDHTGDAVVVRPDGETAAAAQRTSALGMLIFLASLTMLFAAGLVGYVVIRLRADTWPPAGSPGLPRSLWLSTALVLGISATMQAALAGIRAGDQQRLRRRLIAALVLATLFLSVQLWSWVQVMGEANFESHLFGFTLIMLTGLHGAHVVGGIVALVVVWALALRGKYTRADYPGVRNCTLYWHYLTVVWLVLYGVLLLG